MRLTTALLALLAFAATPLAFGQEAVRELRRVADAGETGTTPVDLFRVESSYVFESDFDDDIDYGEQDALQSAIEYSHRFHLTGKFYLRAGFAYNRFDFGESTAPVPDQLFSIAGLVGIDYMVGKETGAFLHFRPGFYTEDDLDSASFDVPMTGGRVFVLQPDRLFVFVGATAAFLRGSFPVLPIAGIIWKPNEQWSFFGMLPEPRITYSPMKEINLFVGGQLVGGSFRTDRDDTIRPQRLSGAQVDYSEYRAGAGVEVRCADAVSLIASGGYAFRRSFDFERADREWKTDPAPYVRVALKAEF